MSRTRTPKDYTNGKIYIIRNSMNSSTYIGSTCQKLSERMAQHRNDCKRKRQQCMKVLAMMFELGVEHFYIELLESFSCKNSDELRKREGELIRELKPDLNKKVECRTSKEYVADNYELVKQRRKKYKDNHKEQIKETSRNYYLKKKEYILEKSREYKENNEEKVRERNLRYYHTVVKGKKHFCSVCNCWVSLRGKARHERSTKHQENMNIKDEN